ncbi:MAG: hypothetical protein MUE73_21115 [Planctomycetes bacterium]|jgi:hypothetical protein|nr:hypothetical protein [Planctomycetota bacterium]
MVHRVGLIAVALMTLACSPKPAAGPVSADPVADVSSIANWTEEESLAFRTDVKPGWLALSAKDVETGEPVRDAAFHSVRFSFEQRLVEAHPPMKVDGPARLEWSVGTLNRRSWCWKLAAGWYQLCIDADGYRNTWTPVFRVEEGRETPLAVELRKANRLKVNVLDERGAPIAEGGVLLLGKDFRAGLHIANGVGERFVPVDEVSIEVGRTFLEEYADEVVTVPLRPGIVNEVTIRLRR